MNTKLQTPKMNTKMKTTILTLAATTRINRERYERNADILGHFIAEIKKTNTFAAKIAETVDMTFGGYTVAKISEKQAYCLARAARECGIVLLENENKKVIAEMTEEEAYEAGKEVYFEWCELQK